MNGKIGMGELKGHAWAHGDSSPKFFVHYVRSMMLKGWKVRKHLSNDQLNTTMLLDTLKIWCSIQTKSESITAASHRYIYPSIHLQQRKCKLILEVNFWLYSLQYKQYNESIHFPSTQSENWEHVFKDLIWRVCVLDPALKRTVNRIMDTCII